MRALILALALVLVSGEAQEQKRWTQMVWTSKIRAAKIMSASTISVRMLSGEAVCG